MRYDIPRAFRSACRTRRRGQALVEFALIASLLFILLVIAVEGGVALVISHTFAEAAREACRQVTAISTPLSDKTTSTAQTVARTVISERFGASSGLAQHADISCSPNPASAAAGERVTVRISYPLPGSWFINRSGSLTIRGVAVYEMQK